MASIYCLYTSHWYIIFSILYVLALLTFSCIISTLPSIKHFYYPLFSSPHFKKIIDFIFRTVLSSQQNWVVSTETLHLPLTPHMHSLPSHQHSTWGWCLCCNQWTYVDASSALKVHSLHESSLLVLYRYILWVWTNA